MKMLRSCRLLLWQVALRLSYNVVIGKTIQKRLFSDIRHFGSRFESQCWIRVF